MAYQNFKPTIWAAGIETELERVAIYALDCNRNYEGDVKQMGDTVRILGVGKPTVTTTTNKAISLSAAETVEDTSVVMAINHVSYFNFKVDDIDKHEASGDIMEALRSEASEALAHEADQLIADLAKDAQFATVYSSVTKIEKANILTSISTGIAKLWKNNVSPNTEIVVTLSPSAAELFFQAYTALDTNNSEYLKNGYLGKYMGATIKMSSTVATDSSGYEYMLIRTKRAIAYAQPLTHVEAYRPESGFADALKGFILYEAKIVRPKEAVVLNAKYS